MLLQFSLTNYRNFKDTATLDFTESKITEHPEHVMRNLADGLGILPVDIIWGANGCGKSNLLKGLWKLRSLVLDAPAALAAAKDSDCFLYDAVCKERPTEYDIVFRISNREYEYQLKMLGQTVAEENLFSRHITDASYEVLFDRDSEGVFLCPGWEETDISALNDNLPLLYFLGTQKREELLDFILDFFRNITFLSPYHPADEVILTAIRSEKMKPLLLMHLTGLGLDITDLSEIPKGIQCIHTRNNGTYEISWENEASGTKQILYLLAALLISRDTGSLLLMEEPELHLHPQALEYLYRLACDTQSNPLAAQLLSVTHETSNMNNRLFRRDELWLIETGKDGSSSLYTLALYLKENGEKVRKDETYFKQYLEGRYGALPAILPVR
jgi:AAA15 family ATPase/GTPase